MKSHFTTELLELLRTWRPRYTQPADAEDAIQEAALRLLQSNDLIESPEAWLKRVAVRLAVDDWRRVSRESCRTGSPTNLPDERPSAFDRVCASEVREAIRTVADRLSVELQIIFALWADGLSLSEMASELRIGRGAVRYRLEQVLSYFRQALAEWR